MKKIHVYPWDNGQKCHMEQRVAYLIIKVIATDLEKSIIWIERST